MISFFQFFSTFTKNKKSQVIVKKIASAQMLPQDKNGTASSLWQTNEFIRHIERHNPCKQRYYGAYEHRNCRAVAVCYSIKINILTFSGFKMYIPATVIGIPASVDASGLSGKSEFYTQLVEHMLSQEKGTVLCLNYTSQLGLSKIAEMQTLPTFIFENHYHSFAHYLSAMRHGYRRRINIALKKIADCKIEKSNCSAFTDEHYRQYKNVMQKTTAKLETLSFEFFCRLPEKFSLHSLYSPNNELVAWNISAAYLHSYYFLFGGINYDLRDTYDSYYNNLISIIRQGIEQKHSFINLGQTAETPKMRLGAKPQNLKMFLRHSNPLLNRLLILTKQFISYKKTAPDLNVFKQ